MFTPASEISGFFFSFLFPPPSSISFHCHVYIFHCEKRSCERSRERDRKGGEKKKKKITLLIMTLEGKLDETDIFQREIGGARLRYETIDTIYHRFA